MLGGCHMQIIWNSQIIIHVSVFSVDAVLIYCILSVKRIENYKYKYYTDMSDKHYI